MLGVLCTPFIAEAHVKWFTTLTPQKEHFEAILSPLFLTVSLLVAILLAVLTQLLPKMMEWSLLQKVDHWLDRLRRYSRIILKYGTAASLIVQALSGSLFAPEFHIESTFQLVMMWTVIIFLLIPHHVTTKIGSLILFILFIHTTIHQGVFHMLDYGFYVAIIGTLCVEKTKIEEWGFPLLYLGTGLSLCWVAVEKWVFPGLSIDIVFHHHIPMFGFAPGVFIMLSAFIEFVVGYLLVVGILNRLLAVVLTGIFILTTTVFGGVEIVGHFIIHIILLIFIIEGVSFYKPPITMHKTKLSQMTFVFLNFIFTLATFLVLYYRFA